jgi:hypothetical protein
MSAEQKKKVKLGQKMKGRLKKVVTNILAKWTTQTSSFRLFVLDLCGQNSPQGSPGAPNIQLSVVY